MQNSNVIDRHKYYVNLDSRRIILLICFLLLLLPNGLSAENKWFKFPPAPPPEEYGNLLINRTSEESGVKPATFSHWIHRLKYTCRVCHFEFEFNMKVNTTEITEEANRSGRYCGASGCHDGKTTFGHDEGNCEKCHNGDIGYGKDKFSRLARFPKTKFGNGVNWSKALKRGLIEPVKHLMIIPPNIAYDKMLKLEADWLNIPPALFPHKTHVKLLDCNNCHPYIFNIKKKATKHFSMGLNLKGEFCGVCHMTVAFPMSECNMCHPQIGSLR
jgi:c(7)-type cytochrome triheme protein